MTNPQPTKQTPEANKNCPGKCRECGHDPCHDQALEAERKRYQNQLKYYSDDEKSLQEKLESSEQETINIKRLYEYALAELEAARKEIADLKAHRYVNPLFGQKEFAEMKEEIEQLQATLKLERLKTYDSELMLFKKENAVLRSQVKDFREKLYSYKKEMESLKDGIDSIETQLRVEILTLTASEAKMREALRMMLNEHSCPSKEGCAHATAEKALSTPASEALSVVKKVVLSAKRCAVWYFMKEDENYDVESAMKDAEDLRIALARFEAVFGRFE